MVDSNPNVIAFFRKFLVTRFQTAREVEAMSLYLAVYNNRALIQ